MPKHNSLMLTQVVLIRWFSSSLLENWLWQLSTPRCLNYPLLWLLCIPLLVEDQKESLPQTNQMLILLEFLIELDWNGWISLKFISGQPLCQETIPYLPPINVNNCKSQFSILSFFQTMSYILRTTYSYISIYLYLNAQSNIPSTIVFPTNQNLKLVYDELITEGFLRAICSSFRLCQAEVLINPPSVNFVRLPTYCWK